MRLRRSILSVPGSEQKMLTKAAGLVPDIVMLDLEDAVAPQRKDDARELVVEALASLEWQAVTVAVRINPVGSRWCLEDVTALLEGAGPRLDLLIVPKVESASQVHFLDRCEEVAVAAGRVEALVFGPGDYAATIGVPQLTIGATDRRYPGDQWHYVLSRIVVAAKARGLAAVDGPYAAIRDLAGLREAATRSRLLGCDGKWALHPDQIAVVNEVFSPSEDELGRARAVMDALQGAGEDGRGVVALAGEMVDEATRKSAEDIIARGRAAGLLG